MGRNQENTVSFGLVVERKKYEISKKKKEKPPYTTYLKQGKKVFYKEAKKEFSLRSLKFYETIS
jgi:hypothetical protein